jgi:asparagine synthetase B (glutamine-hydrolysing)
MGFPVPLGHWYRESPVRDFVADTLRSAAARGVVQPQLVDGMQREAADFDRGIWGLLNLELWMEAFVDSRAAVD